MRLTLLTAPERARTILTLCHASIWSQGSAGSRFEAPTIDHLGTPILLVDQIRAEWVLGLGRLTSVLTPSPSLGSLMISGWPRPTRADERSGELAAYLRDHADCGSSCGAIGTVPIAVEVSRVRMTEPGTRTYASASLVDYLAARPDRLTSQAHSVARHLNEDHGPDLIQLAAAVSDRDPESILGASIHLIDTDGMILTMIDPAGALDVEVEFDQPLSSIDELGSHLHRLLHDPASYRQG